MKFLLSLFALSFGLTFSMAAYADESWAHSSETAVEETAEASRNQCVSRRSVRNFRVESRDSLILRAGARDYRLESRFCHELSWARAINFDTRPRNSAWVCRGDYLLIVDQFNGRVIERCWIDSIERL